MKLNEILAQRLFESQNYLDMYEAVAKRIYNYLIDEGYSEEALTSYSRYMSDAKMMIRELKNILNRRDFIIYMSRIAKVTLCYGATVSLSYEDRNSIIEQEMRKTQQKMDIDANSFKDFHDLKSDFEHYLNLPIPEIQEFEFRDQDPIDVVRYFEQIEEEWKEKTGERTAQVEEDHYKFIDFPDDFAWWVVGEDGRVEQECDLMGHCGTPQESNSWTTLSLREDITDDFVRPHVTAILDNSSRHLVEIKGYGNEKPPEKYNQYIKELLLDDRIEGFDNSNSYMPENDFDPLDAMSVKEIMETKPSLLPRHRLIALQINDMRGQSELISELETNEEFDVYVKPNSIMQPGMIREMVEDELDVVANNNDEYFIENFSSLLYQFKEDYKVPIQIMTNKTDLDEPDDYDEYEELLREFKKEDEDSFNTLMRTFLNDPYFTDTLVDINIEQYNDYVENEPHLSEISVRPVGIVENDLLVQEFLIEDITLRNAGYKWGINNEDEKVSEIFAKYVEQLSEDLENKSLRVAESTVKELLNNHLKIYVDPEIEEFEPIRNIHEYDFMGSDSKKIEENLTELLRKCFRNAEL